MVKIDFTPKTKETSVKIDFKPSTDIQTELESIYKKLAEISPPLLSVPLTLASQQRTLIPDISKKIREEIESRRAMAAQDETLAGTGKRALGEAKEMVSGLAEAAQLSPAILASQFLPSRLSPISRALPEVAKESVADIGATLAAPKESFVAKPLESTMDALILADLTRQGIKGITKMKPVKGLAAETLGFTTGIPQETLTRAFNRPLEVLAKRKEGAIKDIAFKAREGFSFINERQKAELTNEIKALSKIKNPIDPAPIIKNAKSRISEFQAEGVALLSESDISSINSILRKMVKGELTPAKAHKLKLKIDDMVSFGEKAPSSPGARRLQSILKDIRFEINQALRGVSDDYALANDKSSELRELSKALKTGFKDERIERFVSNIVKKDLTSVSPGSQDIFRRELLNRLDDLLPDKYKFYDQISDIVAGAEFKGIFPKKGSAGGLTGGGLFLTSFLTQNPAFLLGLPAASPRLLGATLGTSARIGQIPGGLPAIPQSLKKLKEKINEEKAKINKLKNGAYSE